MKKTLLCIVLLLQIAVLPSCDDNNKQPPTPLKESYQIEMGEDVFNVPVDYLVDSLNRIDAEEVKKIVVPEGTRDSRYKPHGYIILFGNLPDVTPLKDGRLFDKAPNRTIETVQVNMSYNRGGAFKGLDNIIRTDAKKSTVHLPDFSTIKNGLINIGYNDKPKGMYENLYVYLVSGKPIAHIRCDRIPERPNPACRVIAAYNSSITLDIIFSSENLDWFSQQGGFEKILRRVDSWKVKDNKLSISKDRE